MFLCLECNRIFEKAKHYTETHGFETPPYEEWNGCPHCGGSYTQAYNCANCGEYIIGTYIKTQDGLRLCDKCYNECDTSTNE